MKEYICYQANELLKFLGNNFRIINEKVEDNFSDWCTGEVDSEHIEKFYITNKDNIKEIKEWNGLWKEIDIHFMDGKCLKLHSDNVNSDDKSLYRISKNNFFSPSFKQQGVYILSDSTLNKWLLYNKISQEQLNLITKKFCLYPTYIFKGVNEPFIENGKVCGYYGQYMKISEDKIDKALDDIKDIEMKFKIEEIVKSFECEYL